MNKLLIISAIFGLTACAGQQYLTDPKAAEESIECKYDEFAHVNKCTTKTIDSANMGSMSPKVSAYLGAGLSDKNTSVIAINGTITAFGWFNPNYVLDKDGKKFSVTTTNSRIFTCTQYFGCNNFEDINIPLDRKYISDHKNGFSMKIYGDKGTIVINFPAPFVQGFDNLLKSKGI